MEADVALTAMAMGEGNKADEKLFVQFLLHPHPDPVESEKQNRPVFKDTEYVRIIVPGDKTSIVFRPVWDRDKQRFPRHYQMFKNGINEQVVGTPLNIVPWLTKAQVEEMKYFNIRTVEQLANMPDSGAGSVPAFHTLKRKANEFLMAAQGRDERVEELQAKLAERDEQMKAMMERLTALEANETAKKQPQETKGK